MKQTFIIIGLMIFVGLMPHCNSKKTDENEANTSEKATEITLQPSPQFNGDSAYAFVKAQTDFGPRVPNSAAHQACGDYLIAQLKNFGFEVQAQSFEATAYNGTVLKSRNIIGSFNPKATKRLLLAAHWDSRPYNDKEVEDSTQYEAIAGANDGASGVGVLLEIARAIQASKDKPTVGIDIIFFDSEDYGLPENYEGDYIPDTWCLGSQYWAKNKHQENYAAYYGILLDMVGAEKAQFYREGYSMEYAPKINQQVWAIAQKLGYGQYFKNQNSPTIVDDHYYVNKLAGIPMIDIVDYDAENPDSFFPKYHHTHQDDISIISPKTLAAVGQTVLQVIYNEEE